MTDASAALKSLRAELAELERDATTSSTVDTIVSRNDNTVAQQIIVPAEGGSAVSSSSGGGVDKQAKNDDKKQAEEEQAPTEESAAAADDVVVVVVVAKQKPRYRLGKEIASGSFGTVYQAVDISTLEHVAVKCMDMKPSEGVMLQREIAIMQKLGRHPNTVAFLAASYRDVGQGDDKSLLAEIAMEFCPNGTLETAIKNFGPFPEDAARVVATDIVSGLAFLNKNHICHRDLKPANILVGADGTMKLADFGLGKVLASTLQCRANTIGGTPLWMPPEMIQNEDRGYDGFKVDSWALGIILFQMLGSTGRPPWTPKNNLLGMVHQIAICAQTERIPVLETDVRFNDPAHVSDEARDFVRKCLTCNPEKRPLAKELLGHPWLSAAPLRPHVDFSLPAKFEESKPFSAAAPGGGAADAAPSNNSSSVAGQSTKLMEGISMNNSSYSAQM